MFPLTTFHLVFIGPEAMENRTSEYPLPERTASNPYGAVVERVSHNMKISTFVEHYHTLHAAGTFAPFDPYFDMFMLFHPGLGHPGSSEEWKETLPRLLETKLPVLVTGYTEGDMERDVEWVKRTCKGEFDVLLQPGENRFKSLRWDINDADPTDLSQGNWGVWSFRGKRYVFLLLISKCAVRRSEADEVGIIGTKRLGKRQSNCRCCSSMLQLRRGLHIYRLRQRLNRPCLFSANYLVLLP